MALYRELGDKPGQAYALNHLGLVQQETGDYPAAIASHQQALELARDAGDPLAEAVSLTDLAMVQQLTGDYRARRGRLPAGAGAVPRPRLRVRRGRRAVRARRRAAADRGLRGRRGQPAPGAGVVPPLGDRLGQAWALDELGLVQQLTGDYPAAAASLGRGPRVASRPRLAARRGHGAEQPRRAGCPDLGAREGRRDHSEALAMASELGAPPEEARALAGIGRSLLPGSPAEAAGHLREALAIYQRIGSPDARLVQDTLDEHGLLTRGRSARPPGQPAAGSHLR